MRPTAPAASYHVWGASQEPAAERSSARPSGGGTAAEEVKPAAEAKLEAKEGKKASSKRKEIPVKAKAEKKVKVVKAEKVQSPTRVTSSHSYNANASRGD